MFDTEVFRKQMYCIEESVCDIVWTLRRPRSDLPPPNKLGAREVVPLLLLPRFASGWGGYSFPCTSSPPALLIKPAEKSKFKVLTFVYTSRRK